MDISNEFRVSVPVEEAWNVLTDLERIAPCMPGAQLLEINGDEYRGLVKVKVGPIAVEYRGVARMLERNETEHRAVLRAEGRETRGQGNASATVTATLTDDNGETVVSVLTELSITGKVAQFGKGLMADVSGKVLGQFVRQLEADVLSGSNAGDSTTPESEQDAITPENDSYVESSESTASQIKKNDEVGSVRTISSNSPKAVDLLRVAGSSMAKRIVPAVIVLAGVVGFVWWIASR